MDKDRRLAFLILKDIEQKGSWSNLAVNHHLSGGNAGDPAFIREFVYGILRNQFLLDYNINRFLKKTNIGLSERILLRMGFYQLSEMDSVPDHAAVSETVKIADAFVKGKKPFINAVLRNFQREGGKLQLDKNNISVNYSCHQSIIDVWLKSYGAETTEKMLQACNTIPPFTIRRNPLKDAKPALDFSIDGEDFRLGYFSVQDEASQLAVNLLDPQPGCTLIDVCAAPGGKTCAAAERMQNSGRILAFDLYEHRAALIVKEADRLGISIIDAAQRDAMIPMTDLEASADYVICDVPCSGLGVLRRKPEMKLKDISEELQILPGIQKTILRNASETLKSKGRILYSTCTVNPAENQDVVRDFLSEHPDFSVREERQLFPEEGGHDGFYICIMEKL